MDPKHTPEWRNHIAKASGSLVILTGASVCLAYVFGSDTWQSFIPGAPKMAPGTAVFLMVAGAALWCMLLGQRMGGAGVWRELTILGAGLITLFGLLKLAESFFGWHLGLDYLFFPRPAVDPVVIAPATAAAFVLFGAALVLVRFRRRWWVFERLVLAGGFVGWLGVSRYIFGGESIAPFRTMAPNTAAAFVLLNIGAIVLRSDGELFSLWLVRNAGGQMLRRLLLPALFLLVLSHYAEAESVQAGRLEPGTIAWLFTILDMVIFGALIWGNAAMIDRAEKRRSMAEEKLDASLEQTRAIVECSDDAIISKTLDGIITSWNNGAAKLFGYSALEAVGQPMLMIFPTERVEEEAQILERIRRGESLDHYETVRVCKDGSRLEVSVTISPLRDSGGRIYGASKIARDITARKQEGLKLKTQLAQLELLHRITRSIGERQALESVYDVVIRSLEAHFQIDFGCVCLHDETASHFTVTQVGHQCQPLARSLGLVEKSKIAIGSDALSRCLHGDSVYEPDIRETNTPFLTRLAEGGLCAMVITPLAFEGQIFALLIVGRRLPNSFSSAECEFLRQLGEHTALAAHQAQLNAALQRAYDDLRLTQQSVMQQERLRALGEMASGVAHDINNSLSPVVLYLDMLMERESGIGAASRQYLETIQTSVSDVVQTISRLREFYRQREPQITVLPVQLNELARQVVELTRARWGDLPQRRGLVIRIELHLDQNLPLILGVESELREALINLVFNAADAMPAGGVLTLRTKTANSRVWAQVEDTGVGMSEETRRRCLEPFFTTKGEHGTGLGLPMVYGVARRHQAELEIESELGRGTTISLVFPAKPSASIASEASASAPTLPRLRLLVVDDDPLLLQALCHMLESDGHSVVTANGGQAGVAAFTAGLSDPEPFAAVFTDLGMPHTDGRAVAKAVKAASSTPVILLTGWGRRVLTEDDTPEHVDYVLSKPPRAMELREALGRFFSDPPRGD